MKATQTRKIGIIHSADCVNTYELDPLSRMNGYEIGGIYSPATLASRYKTAYPTARQVEHPLDIVNDDSVELIYLFQEARQPENLLQELLRTGKPVRIL